MAIGGTSHMQPLGFCRCSRGPGGSFSSRGPPYFRLSTCTSPHGVGFDAAPAACSASHTQAVDSSRVTPGASGVRHEAEPRPQLYLTLYSLQLLKSELGVDRHKLVFAPAQDYIEGVSMRRFSPVPQANERAGVCGGVVRVVAYSVALWLRSKLLTSL